MTRKSAALALACAAAVSLPAARAQNAPADTPAAPEAVAPLPELAYDTYFEPFTDNPLYRIHDPQPLTPPPPLFQKFDPLEGLSRPAKVSRVTLPGDRVVLSMPVISARVGQDVDVPLIVNGRPTWTGVRVGLEYDTQVLRPVEGLGAGIPTEDVDMNPNPAPGFFKGDAPTLIALNVVTRPWREGGTALRIRFHTLSEGDAPLRGALIEMSDEHFDLLPSLFRDGLVRVTP